MENCCDLYIISTIACKIAECLTDEELALAAANFTMLGDALALIAAKRACCEKQKESTSKAPSL
ncbi:MAG: hypothetical protein PHY47_11500 [Lachnospiraceae bacterium]|nr:hypothetical protein [Lachnospiraceae bacterium]